MKNIFLSLFILIFLATGVQAQSDEEQIRAIFDAALTEGEAYENLRQLCKNVGHRLSGSEGAEKAVFWSEEKMNSYGFDKVWLQGTNC